MPANEGPDLAGMLAQIGDLITRYKVLVTLLDRLLEELSQIERDLAAQRAALETLCSD